MKGIPIIQCSNCGRDTIKSIYIHLCQHCKEDYRNPWEEKETNEEIPK